MSSPSFPPRLQKVYIEPRMYEDFDKGYEPDSLKLIQTISSIHSQMTSDIVFCEIKNVLELKACFNILKNISYIT